jgi:hypothetical protein
MLREGRAVITNPDAMQTAHDVDNGLLNDEHRAQIRAVLAAQQIRGIEDARRLVVGTEACLRAGGEYAERLRAALLELLGDALAPPRPVEPVPQPDPPRTRRFWQPATNRANARTG